ncbi:hypothetical protein N2152v2_011023 [Parachlorella kessleri]
MNAIFATWNHLFCKASAEAGALLSAGLQKYVSGDKYGALTLFEDCLKKDPSREDRLAALWNATCIHAYFGDAEVAQIMLREAVALGLDFEAALLGSDPRMVKLQASAQILIKLRKFSQATAKSLAAAEANAAQAPPAAASSRQRSSKSGRSILTQDVSDLTKTEMQGIDTSMLGVVRRVAVLLVALVAFGVGLFYFGLQFLEQ